MRWPVLLVVVALSACHPPPKPQHWKKQPHAAALVSGAAQAPISAPAYQTTP